MNNENIRTEDENRKTVSEDLKKNLFIEAGAGAGKTTLLVARAVNLLTQDDVDPSQVVIITFTNAAASELYERIVNELRFRRKQAEENHDGKQAEKLKNVLNHIDRMDISTIHHFCNAMLQQRIFDAQLGMNTSYSEEDDVVETKKAFLKDLLGGRNTSDEQEKQKIDQDLRKLKDVLGYGYKNQIENLFCVDNMADKEDAVYVVNEEVLKDDWNDYKKHAYDVLRKILDIGEKYEDSIWELYQKVPLKQGINAVHERRDIYNKISGQSNQAEEDKKLLMDEIRVAVEKYEHGNDSYVIPMVKKLKAADNEKKVSQTYIFAHSIKKIATKSSFPKDQQNEFDQLKKAWNNEASRADDEAATVLNSDFTDFRKRIEAYQTGLVVKFVAECAKEYQENRDSSSISNDTLLYRTRDLLENKQARKILSERYRYLFVDEYQDTDQLQTDIIWNLCRKEDNPDQLRDGSLVIVGDPKQSIYRFRGADATLFEKMKDRFAKLQQNDPEHNEVIVLHDNYRSNPDIISAVNEKFKVDFASQAKEESDASGIIRDDPAYEEMNAGKAREEAGMPDDTLHGVFGCYLENQKTAAEKAAEKLAKKNKTVDQNDQNKVNKKVLYDHKITDLIWNLCHKDVKIMVKGENGYEKRKIHYSDILVLAWKKDEVESLVGGLKQHHIPVNAMGSINIKTMPMRTLIRIMKYLANPNDAITKALAVSSIYGGMISNLPKEEYEKLTGQLSALRYLIRNARSYENLNDDNPKKKEFQADCDKYGLYDLHEISGHRDACSIIRYLINHTDLLYPCNMNAGDSDQMEESLPLDYDQKKQFNNLAEAVEQQGIYDLSEAAEYLEKYLYAEHEREAELMPGLDQVRVMNAHKAKGLQSPVVIVKKDTRRKNPETYQEDNHYYMAFNQQKTYVYDEEITKKAELATDRDKLNLNYVVDTRAGEVLILMNEKEPDQKKAKASSPILDHPPKIEDKLGGKIDPAPENPDPEQEENIEKVNLSDVYKGRNTDFKKNKDLSIDLYQSIIPSDFEKAQTSSGNEGETADKEERPSGAVFGTVMHRCFELFVNRRETILNEKDSSASIQKIISQAVMENISDIPEEDVPKYQKYLTKVLTAFRNNNDMMEKIRNAEEAYTEFPFSYYKDREKDKTYCDNLLNALKQDEKDSEEKELEKDQTQKLYIHGACDLVLKTGSSVSVIDYKSDECHTADHKAFEERKYKTYQGQLTLYQYAMAEVFHVKPEDVSTELYLVDIH